MDITMEATTGVTEQVTAMAAVTATIAAMEPTAQVTCLQATMALTMVAVVTVQLMEVMGVMAVTLGVIMEGVMEATINLAATNIIKVTIVRRLHLLIFIHELIKMC